MIEYANALKREVDAAINSHATLSLGLFKAEIDSILHLMSSIAYPLTSTPFDAAAMSMFELAVDIPSPTEANLPSDQVLPAGDANLLMICQDSGVSSSTGIPSSTSCMPEMNQSVNSGSNSGQALPNGKWKSNTAPSL